MGLLNWLFGRKKPATVELLNLDGSFEPQFVKERAQIVEYAKTQLAGKKLVVETGTSRTNSSEVPQTFNGDLEYWSPDKEPSALFRNPAEGYKDVSYGGSDGYGGGGASGSWSDSSSSSDSGSSSSDSGSSSSDGGGGGGD